MTQDLQLLKNGKQISNLEIASTGEDVPFNFTIKNVSDTVLNNIDLDLPNFVERKSKIPDSLNPGQSAIVDIVVKGHLSFKGVVQLKYSYIKVKVS
jgi:hypothetical protein